jgi:Tol biopolymer transport system component
MLLSISRIGAFLITLTAALVGASRLAGGAAGFSLTMVGQRQDIVFVDPFRCNYFRVSTSIPLAAQSVRMSPDGQRLALIGREPGAGEALGVYVANWDGTELRQTGYFDVYEYTLAWTEDSRYISYIGTLNEFNAAFAIDTLTDTRELIFSEAEENIYGFEWSHDGRFAAVTKERRPFERIGNRYIHLIDMETGEKRELPEDDLFNNAPRWSPNDTYILYTIPFFANAGIGVADTASETIAQRFVNRLHPRMRTAAAEWMPNGADIFLMLRETDQPHYHFAVQNLRGERHFLPCSMSVHDL